VSLLISDYDLLERIGAGAYGEVWRARSTATGVLRAVKVVYLSTFNDDRPFNREFEGIKKFEEISRSHPSQLAIFHVGRNDAARCFYYVLELADGASTAGQPDSDSYRPHTLRHDLQTQGHLPAARVVELGLALTEALAHLHQHGLVHRDIKPSNIIFVKGRPKLADIGLVTDAGDARSIVGTEGYLAPEGPGTPQADIFALGKVLYEAATGLDRSEFPKLPPDLREWPDGKIVLELNEVFLRACAASAGERYANAAEMREELARLAEGKSLRCAHQLANRWRMVRRAAAWGAAAACLIVLIIVASRSRQPPENPEITKRSTNEFAQNQYELGFSFYRKAGDWDSAAKYLKAATNADPNFVLAQSKLAWNSCAGGTLPFGYEQFPDLSNGLVLAQHALARDDHLAYAHMAVAWHAFIRERDWNKAIQHFEKAIRCDPNNGEVHIWYGLFLSTLGRTNQAMRQLETAGLSGPEVDLSEVFGSVLFAARDYAKAAEKFQTAMDLPDAGSKTFLYTQLTRNLFWRDRTDDALVKWMEVTHGAKEEWVADLERVLRQEGRAAFWNRRLEAVRARSKDPVILADACAMANRTEEALACLEKALREHHDFLVLRLKNDPEWDKLRDQPRFKAILKALNLSE
jgi:serine/threonine protein kinase